jgi:hypothetical protein
MFPLSLVGVAHLPGDEEFAIDIKTYQRETREIEGIRTKPQGEGEKARHKTQKANENGRLKSPFRVVALRCDLFFFFFSSL